MSIPNRQRKIIDIVDKIKTGISCINTTYYHRDSSLNNYQKVIASRKRDRRILDFIQNDNNLKLIYDTLISWDMNKRGAKIKAFPDFIKSIRKVSKELDRLEKILRKNLDCHDELLDALGDIFQKLHVMKSKSRFVSNAKLLHFLFPNFLIPMDRINTLQYFYGNGGESKKKYLEIIDLAFEIMTMKLRWRIYLNGKKDNWNTNKPKLIDNAIILLPK